MKLIYPSEIAVQAFGLTVPDLPVHQGEPSACGFCGKPILPGDRCAPSANSEMFGDTRRLATYSGLCCPECSAVRKKPVMNAASFALLTLDGAYKIAGTQKEGCPELLWLFTSPPTPPFVVTRTTAKMAHLIWKAPVTTSRKKVFVQFGDRQLFFNPEKLAEAQLIAQKISQKASANGVNVVWPLHLDTDLVRQNIGQMTSKAKLFATSDDQSFFASLSLGELWALAHMLRKDPVAPKAPEKFTIKIKESADETE